VAKTRKATTPAATGEVGTKANPHTDPAKAEPGQYYRKNGVLYHRKPLTRTEFEKLKALQGQ
jgi:hypothetical protein